MRMTQTIGDRAQLAMVPEGRQRVLPPVRGREEMPTVGVGKALRRNPSSQENETVECFDDAWVHVPASTGAAGEGWDL